MSDLATPNGASPGPPVPSGASPGQPARVAMPGPLVALAALVLVLLSALLLREVASLVVPILFGLFLALITWPLVGSLERRGARHAVSLTIALLVVLGIVLAAGGIIALSVGELVVQIPKYQDRLSGLIDSARDLLAQFGINPDAGALTSIIDPSTLGSLVRPVASAVSGAGVTIFVLTFTMIYAVAGGASLGKRAESAFGERHALLVGIEQFGIDLRRYLQVRALLGLFAAVLVLILLVVLGIPLPLLWAFLVFAASFIPNVGTIIALIPPLVLALLTGGIVPAVAVLVGYTLINFAQDHFLQPVVMGSELNLSPLVVFIAVIVWAWIFGAAGALLAVPLTVGLVALMEAFPETRPIAALLRNRLDAPPGFADAVAADATLAEAVPADGTPAGTIPGD
jgi:AI-2 transport protein TqsA